MGPVVVNGLTSPPTFVDDARAILAARASRWAVALLLCAAALLACAFLAPSEAAAAGGACIADQPEQATGPPPRNVCIADTRFRARGRINPRCLEFAPIPGQRYPSPNWCRAGGDQIEVIAHSRFLAVKDGGNSPLATVGIPHFGIAR